MNSADLRHRLADIIRMEHRPAPDWAEVERACDRLAGDIERHLDVKCPVIVFHFLSDADIRAKDAAYGHRQRVEIRRFVETGECNDSKSVSPLGCVAVVVAIVALFAWIRS